MSFLDTQWMRQSCAGKHKKYICSGFYGQEGQHRDCALDLTASEDWGHVPHHGLGRGASDGPQRVQGRLRATYAWMWKGPCRPGQSASGGAAQGLYQGMELIFHVRVRRAIQVLGQGPQ